MKNTRMTLFTLFILSIKSVSAEVLPEISTFANDGLYTAQALGDSKKSEEITPEKACNAFKSIKAKMDKLVAKPEDIYYYNKLALYGTLAVLTGEALIEYNALKTHKAALGIIFRDPKYETFDSLFEYYNIPPKKLSEVEIKKFMRGKNKQYIKEFVEGLSRYIKFGGITTIAAVGYDYLYLEKTTSQIARDFVDAFVPAMGDATPVAGYVSFPEKFFKLDPVEACGYLNADKLSKNAEVLRVMTMAFWEKMEVPPPTLFKKIGEQVTSCKKSLDDKMPRAKESQIIFNVKNDNLVR